jgi:hypothetical protein
MVALREQEQEVYALRRGRHIIPVPWIGVPSHQVRKR